MYPNLFIGDDFFTIFDNAYKALGNQSIYNADSDYESKRNSLIRIRDLFLSSNIRTDVKDQAVIKYWTREFETHENIRDLVLHKIVKDHAYANSRSLETNKQIKDCHESNFCFFSTAPLEEHKKQFPVKGRIVVGSDFLSKPFYLNHTFATESTDETIPQISRMKHPCTSLVIIDRYLFEDASTSKIPNLILLLRTIIPQDLSCTFEVDIITRITDNNDKRVESKYNQILTALSNKISLHVYCSRRLEEHDRYFITNYAIFSIGIPFTGNSNISCNFYPSNVSRDAIKTSFKHWLSKIEFAKRFIKSTPPNLGSIRTIWRSDNIEHSIFENDQL